jgi:hypothetical protein
MNKKIWVGVYVASFLLFLAATLAVGLILLLQMDQAAEFRYETVSLAFALGVLAYFQFIIVQAVYNFAILAKMWGAIQDGQTPISIGKAIGFLFIPFFNVYWIFVVWGSFPTHYNNFIERQRLNAPRLTSGVYSLFPLMILLTGIFVFPLLAMPLVFAFVIARTCDAVNELKAANEEKQTGIVRKLVPAMVAAAVIVPLFLFAGFSVFALRNMNPKATAAEIPETVGKFRRGYSNTHGSVFGLRSEYSAVYKLSGKETGGGSLYYRMIDFTRPTEAVERLKKFSYCSNSPKKEGVIKDKNGNQIGEFVQCGNQFYALVKNRYVSVDGGNYAAFELNDIIEFYANLPFNSNVDTADLATTLKTSSSIATTFPKSGN